MNYDFGSFHPKCNNRSVIAGPTGWLVVCFDCSVAADLEAVSGKCTPLEIIKLKGQKRNYQGKFSPGLSPEGIQAGYEVETS